MDGYEASDVAGLLTDRLTKARERLDESLETVKALCEPVMRPRDTQDYLHYFCARDTRDKDALVNNEQKRLALYKEVAALMRSYANLANEMEDAGYSYAETAQIKADVTHYDKMRDEVKIASGDYLDMKRYEPAMRRLLDCYICASDSEVVSEFEELARRVSQPGGGGAGYPQRLDTPGKRSLYDNLGENEVLALQIDEVVRYTKKDGWVGNRFKEREVACVIREKTVEYEINVDKVLELVKKQQEYQ